MCGIAVLFGKLGSTDECRKILQEMIRIVAHRGPDDEGGMLFPEKFPPFSLNENITNNSQSKILAALGHRRLSIVDLSSAGHQPMSTSNGRYWITYNGEIYNHPELRKELESEGVSFHTETDTEVILQAYALWGIHCLHRFNGMFAFTIIDRQERKVFAARDRFGVKPLYIWKAPRGTYVLSSEIKQFTCHPEWKSCLNHQRAYDFLNWSLTDHTEETLFKGVKQILGGHYFLCSLDEEPRPQPWYFLPQTPIKKSFAEASTYFQELFFDAVAIRLRADVEVGSCLSGGLDSSSIVCAVDHLLSKKINPQQQKTFSACNFEKEFDEKAFAEEVVRGRRLEAHYLYPTCEKLFESLNDLVYSQDEPFTSTSVFAQWLIFKTVKQQKVVVMLDGQGADEQLAGYHSFYGHQMAEYFKKLKWFTLAKQMFLIKKQHRQLPLFMMFVNRLLPPLLRNPLSKILGRTHHQPSWFEASKWQVEWKNPLSKFSIPDANSWGKILTTVGNLPMLLRYEDRNSMAHSIESRTPFLDYRLVEFCLNLPIDYKLQGSWTKYILRHSMGNYLPKAIATRRDKMAFATNEEKWMKQHPHFFRSLFKESINSLNGMLAPNIIEEFDEMIAGKKTFSYLPWRVISFGLWMKRMGIEQ